MVLDQEQEIRDINQEIINNKNPDDSDNRNYINTSAVIGFMVRGL
jgi:hypothetical protein